MKTTGTTLFSGDFSMNEEMRKWERMLRHDPIEFEPGGSTLCLIQKTLSL